MVTTSSNDKKEIKNRPGNKPMVLDNDLIFKMAMDHCTVEEIAAKLGYATGSLNNSDRFNEVYKKGVQAGKVSLRRLQFQMAEGITPEYERTAAGDVLFDKHGRPVFKRYGHAPQPALAIFLGKNLLGQTDQQTIKLNAEKPVEVIIKNYEKGEKKDA